MASMHENITGLTMAGHGIGLFVFFRYYLKKEPLNFWSKIILFLKGIVVSEVFAIVWMSVLDYPGKLSHLDSVSILNFTAGVLGISVLPACCAFLFYIKFKGKRTSI